MVSRGDEHVASAALQAVRRHVAASALRGTNLAFRVRREVRVLVRELRARAQGILQVREHHPLPARAERETVPDDGAARDVREHLVRRALDLAQAAVPAGLRTRHARPSIRSRAGSRATVRARWHGAPPGDAPRASSPA